MDQRRQWIIAQIGSRQHYAVPRGFNSIGQLKLLFTDGWCPRLLRPLLLRGNAMMRGFAGRWHVEMPSSKVVSWNLRAVSEGVHRARMVRPTREETYLDYVRIGGEFDASMLHYLKRPGRVDPANDAFFGFNTGCLETIRMLRSRGVPTVLDQIDPARTEEEIVLAEIRKFPGWQELPGLIPEEYWDRLSAEWASADLVLVNSNWTRTALIQQGVAPEKIIIVPLAYEPAVGPVPMPLRKDRPLTVLWLGSVILRKGIQYLMEAARLLLDTDLKFVIAGPIGISKDALNTAPRNMSFIGRVTREQIHDFYQTADIFVLPTLSDGFAITQVEAMNRGLPVIATPNCGEVVEDGKNGLVVPVCDGPALARAISRLNDDRALLGEMAQNAFIHSTKYLLPNQARASDAAVAAYVAARDPKPKPLARVTAVQDGARLHYALPVAFHRSGCLERMYSEWFLKNKFAYRLLGAIVRRLNRPELRGFVERRCDEIPPAKVYVNPPLIVKQRRARAGYIGSEAYFKWCSGLAGKWILRHGMGNANVLYGFIRNIDPELLRHYRAAGILTVADQIIAPAAVERDEFRRQLERWPDWEPQSVHPDFEVLIDFEKQTWDALDRIVCASEYVRRGLLAQGIADSRITLAPYPIDATHFPFIDRRYRSGELLVGFVGGVGLRKGTPYFAEISKRLRGKNIKFMMVGAVSLTDAAARRTAENVELVGRVNRSRVPEYLERFDVFLFPSTCEGSAGAAMEAMAYGLPIVASPNSGTVIREGIDGLIRPYDDIDGLCACVEKLAADKSLRLEMGRQARLHAESITIGRYGRELIKVIEADLASR